jgi:hypothetical protein
LASKAYAKQQQLGIVSADMTFAAWATQNAPGYMTATENVQAASSKLLELTAEIGGPLSFQYAEDLNTLKAALYPANEMEG